MHGTHGSIFGMLEQKCAHSRLFRAHVRPQAAVPTHNPSVRNVSDTQNAQDRAMDAPRRVPPGGAGAQTETRRRGEVTPSRASITSLVGAARTMVPRRRNSGNGRGLQSARTRLALWWRSGRLPASCQRRGGVLAVYLVISRAAEMGIKTAGTRLQTPSVCSPRPLLLPPLPLSGLLRLVPCYSIHRASTANSGRPWCLIR